MTKFRREKCWLLSYGSYLQPASCQCFSVSREQVRCSWWHGELQQVCHLFASLFRSTLIDDIITVVADRQTEPRPKVRVRLVAEKRCVSQHAESALFAGNECRWLVSIKVAGVLTACCYIRRCPVTSATRRLTLRTVSKNTQTDNPIYTVSQKTPKQSFCDKFGERESILIILSLLHSEMNCRKGWNKICHLASNTLPHYLAKFECSTVQPFIHVSQDNLHIRW